MQVLCASNAGKVTPLVPPEGAAPGDKISVSGYDVLEILLRHHFSDTFCDDFLLCSQSCYLFRLAINYHALLRRRRDLRA